MAEIDETNAREPPNSANQNKPNSQNTPHTSATFWDRSSKREPPFFVAQLLLELGGLFQVSDFVVMGNMAARMSMSMGFEY